jgi:hypothetical protein
VSTYVDAFTYCEVFLEKTPTLNPLAKSRSAGASPMNIQYSRSACSMVFVIRFMMPEDVAGCTDDEIMKKLYNEDDALSDFI